MTAPNNWDKARKLKLIRKEPGMEKKTHVLEPGVNFFVAMLDQLGCPTYFSCQGHPRGFYIMFHASYNIALKLSTIGYFEYQIHGKNTWIMRINDAAEEATIGPITKSGRTKTFRYAAEAWEERLGKLNFRRIRREI